MNPGCILSLNLGEEYTRSPHSGPSSPSLHNGLALGPGDPPPPWSLGSRHWGILGGGEDFNQHSALIHP